MVNITDVSLFWANICEFPIIEGEGGGEEGDQSLSVTIKCYVYKKFSKIFAFLNLNFIEILISMSEMRNVIFYYVFADLIFWKIFFNKKFQRKLSTDRISNLTIKNKNEKSSIKA